MQGTLALPRQRGIDAIANEGMGEQIALAVGPQQMPLNHGTGTHSQSTRGLPSGLPA